jgi:hypothetical protein
VVKASKPFASLHDSVGQAGFEDGCATGVGGGDAGGVEVGDGYSVAESGETDRGDQADVAGTEQEQVHEVGLRCGEMLGRSPEP